MPNTYQDEPFWKKTERVRLEKEAQRKREAAAQKKEPVEFAFVEKCHALVKDYRAARKQHLAGRDKLKAEYRGDRLQQELAEHETATPDKEAVVSALNAHARTYLDFLSAKETAAMNDPTMDEAFKWLSRPVALKEEELQQLHDAHADNPLFCRALKEYVAARKDQYEVTLDFRDSISVRREIVEGFTRLCEEYVRDLDDWNFDFADAGGYFEDIDERLKGNGLFEQPKVVEPDEGEETPTAETPALDGFAKEFSGS